MHVLNDGTDGFTDGCAFGRLGQTLYDGTYGFTDGCAFCRLGQTLYDGTDAVSRNVQSVDWNRPCVVPVLANANTISAPADLV